MTMELEAQLWSRSVTDWTAVARYLIDGLAELLAQPIVVDAIDSDGDAFSCALHAAPAPPLQLSWRGVLGMEPIEGRSLVSATLIVFVLGERVRVGAHGSSTVELVYEPRAGEPGRWRCEGWRADDYGEWDGVAPP